MKNKKYKVTIKTHRDKNGGHPHIIMDNIEDKHVSVGLTTKKKKGKNGSPNYEMESNPLNNEKKSYMRRQGTVAPKGEYFGSRKGEITENDFKHAKAYSDRAKEKYKNKKK